MALFYGCPELWHRDCIVFLQVHVLSKFFLGVPIQCFQVETLISVVGGYAVNMERWEEMFNPPFYPIP